MDSEKIFCSLPDHSNEEAEFFCPECKMNMCSNCNKMHSNFFRSLHHQYKIEKEKENNNSPSISLCQEKNHFQELMYYCETHNKLCCAFCIVKVKDEINGKHGDCNVYKLDEIEEEQKNKLKENLKNLENLSKYIDTSITELKNDLNKSKENNDNLKLTIQQTFNKIRNQLDLREKELLSEADKNMNDLSMKKNIINKLEEAPKKIESFLNKGKLIENKWKENNLSISITQCLNIEKNLEEINSYKDIINKNTGNNLLLKFKPEMNNINDFLDTIKKFGCIYNINDIQEKLNNKEDIENFLINIDKDKEKIYNQYIQNKKKIKLIEVKSNLKLIKKEKNEEIDSILKSFESLLNFSKEKRIIFVNFNSKFWDYLFKNYNEPNLKCIRFCNNLRKIFISYHDLFNEFYIDEKEKDYKNDINEFYEKDEFASYLDNNIKNLIEKKIYSDIENIGILIQYDPYYNIDDINDKKKYEDKRDLNILDYLNFENENIPQGFIDTFKYLRFEIIFEKDIVGFLNKITSKINGVSTFNVILEIIDIKKIGDKLNVYFELIQEKYENIIKKEIESLNDKELDKGIEILTKFYIKFYLNENLYLTIEENIKQLGIKFLILIYKNLILYYKEKQYEKLSEFIFQAILQELKNNINNIDLT